VCIDIKAAKKYQIKDDFFFSKIQKSQKSGPISNENTHIDLRKNLELAPDLNFYV
jgi:hypothetical protein